MILPNLLYKHLAAYLVIFVLLFMLSCQKDSDEEQLSSSAAERVQLLEYYRGDLIEVGIFGRDQKRLNGVDIFFDDNQGHKMDLSVGFYESGNGIKVVINNLSHDFRVVGLLKEEQLILQQPGGEGTEKDSKN